MSNKLTILSAQINLIVGDIEGNAQRIIDIMQKAALDPAIDLVLFPELTLTGYSPDDLLLRSQLDNRVQAALQKICSTPWKTPVIVGYPHQADGKRYNAAAVIKDGEVTTRYFKQQLPNYNIFDEARYFTPGNAPCILTIKGIKIGLLICEDLWYETPMEKSVLQGAQLIVSINASPFAQYKTQARHNLLQKRSKTHKTPIIYLNNVGGQDELCFDGGSVVYNAKGIRVQQGAFFQEDMMQTQFSIADNRVSPEPSPLKKDPTLEEKTYHALVLGTRDYINKNQFPGALIGLSGGLDSALTLSIAVDAIGPDRVKAIYMPSRFNAAISQEDAQDQTSRLNVAYEAIPIDNLVDAYRRTLTPILGELSESLTLQNIQARIRGNLLMAASNKTGALVLTTSNKSELAVGYATLYGDMAGGFSVLKDVYKTLAYSLSDYRNGLEAVIPERVIQRPPSAELTLNQCDQDDLPPYSILDPILKGYIEHYQDDIQLIAQGHDPDIVRSTIKKIKKNEHKRQQAAIGVRITSRAFGKDWRVPITCRY